MYKWYTAESGHARNPLLVPSAIRNPKFEFLEYRDRNTKN